MLRKSTTLDRIKRYSSGLDLQNLHEGFDDNESLRLALENEEARAEWRFFGPYLSERQWGTVREDYSENSDSWGSFPHDHAHQRTYRWGEDGLMGICDADSKLCLAMGLWNEKDHIIKERLFGLTGPQGNHGEDVKELYYYLDSTPTHSYMKALYKYPQSKFPYQELLDVNRGKGKLEPEFELIDTGVFNDNRYWDVQVEYAKQSPYDILCKITVTNRGPDEATIHVIPQLWFRNTWTWGMVHEGYTDGDEPSISFSDISENGILVAETLHEDLEDMFFFATPGQVTKGSGQVTDMDMWFTNNETNKKSLYNVENTKTPYVKDAFHRYLINGEKDAINPEKTGTKCAAHYRITLSPGGEAVVRLRLRSVTCEALSSEQLTNPEVFDGIVAQRLQDADDFYNGREVPNLKCELRQVQRQAYAGLLWTKQYFYYIVEDWLKGDPKSSAPPEARWKGRNHDWQHIYCKDILSMPDKWEYPWFAAWDLAFHMIPFARIDPEFAKQQLHLFTDERYMHPNGQIPAYEFVLGDVNPPVHAWGVLKVYKMEKKGKRDIKFLKSCFHKLLLNFTWWVNCKDHEGRNIFGGGFLGLDNIGVFDRSRPLPTGGQLEQADGTSWMVFFCGIMLEIAMELAVYDNVYEEMAGKFFEHFIQIADALNNPKNSLWDEEDGFYYDSIRFSNKHVEKIKIRSLVGLVPMFAGVLLSNEVLKQMPTFKSKVEWFLQNRRDLANQVAFMTTDGESSSSLYQGTSFPSIDENTSKHYLLAIPSKERLGRILVHLLDENKFLSPYGIRSLSKEYELNPYVYHMPNGESYEVKYVPGDSDSYMFGGNSNWRGPVWLPMNYLIVASLERFYFFYGDKLQVECPTGSGHKMNLKEVAKEISTRLSSIFIKNEKEERPCHGLHKERYSGEDWNDLILFYEYFEPDTGRGIGASHQTGWTALVARLIDRLGGFPTDHLDRDSDEEA